MRAAHSQAASGSACHSATVDIHALPPRPAGQRDGPKTGARAVCCQYWGYGADLFLSDPPTTLLPTTTAHALSPPRTAAMRV